ncbi:MAG: cytochrome o ubiquinol oxidase subunit IV [Pantoea sp. Brub]|nr:cytochrome o ubiquinol oxidase subunit IV [Pantoea sp. Brub]
MNHFIEKNDTSQTKTNLYLIGFILSVILTIISFGIVILHNVSTTIISIIVLICAVSQILVHLFCFLHLNTKSEQGWNMITIIFAMIIIFIIISGSLWIMWHLNYNMISH